MDVLPPRGRVSARGIPGDFEEMIPVFGACLQVGKLSRAAQVLRRLGTLDMDFVGGEELMELHHVYLRAEIKALQQLLQQTTTGDRTLDQQQQQHYDVERRAQELQKWYELQIRGQALPQTAETIALMLKVALLSCHGDMTSPRLERLVNRYMGMAPAEQALEVLSMADILSDHDLAIITRICTDYSAVAVADAATGVTAVEHQNTTEKSGADVTTTNDIAPGNPTPRTSSDEEILVTPQKGLGLMSLKKNLSLFSEIPDGHDIASLPYEQRRQIQARLEQDSVDAAIERWQEENEALVSMGLNPAMAAPHMKYQIYTWYTALESRLQELFAKIDEMDLPDAEPQKYDLGLYGPFIRQSTPGRLAAITIISVLNTMAIRGIDKGASVSQAISNLSKAVEDDIRIQSKGQLNQYVKAKRARRVYFSQGEGKVEKELQAAEEGSTPESSSNVFEPRQFQDKAWPISIRTRVGATLLSALIETAKVTVTKEHPKTNEILRRSQAAFSHLTHFKKGKKIGMIMPHPKLIEDMVRQPSPEFLTSHLPMVVEPEPWSKFDVGGYIKYPTPLVRMKNNEKDQKIYAEAAIARGDMDQMFKGLDVLGRTAWRINRPVLDVMLEAWNTGEAIADIPALHPDVSVPLEPDANGDPMQRSQWLRAVKAAENERAGLHSQRCFMNLQLEIARAYRDQTFYFPHNVDFRGRAYPVPEYLNHMGADHVRGLLRFAKGKELGERGLRWLKIHLANVYGYDKASLSEREQFAADNWDSIVDSVNNPLSGKRWWLKAEEPWQCLAACYELKAAMDLPDPSRYVSHLPVHQDGTCNGLQHYAALGGDAYGARQVNLEPGDRPADVYSGVAELVKEHVAKDVERGNVLAKAIEGKITRKVVKQTVMTSVYGVTFIGAKRQILRQLDAAYPDLEKDTGIQANLIASYVAVKVFKALSTMFRGAHEIQSWLGECGNRVCRALTAEQIRRVAEGADTTTPKRRANAKKSAARMADDLLDRLRSTVIWTTPLRMPVVHPYRKSGNRKIRTVLQELQLNSPQRVDPVDRRKQLQALPPNFIHSLDASHMMLTALECDARGLVFAAVHDSFWTHAADVDALGHVLRDAFIRIHAEDVVSRLRAEFEARYKGAMYLARIDRDSDVAKKIVSWRKKTRLSVRDELLLEDRRRALLASSDPDDVSRGKKMVTPASIYEAHAGQAAAVVTPPAELTPLFPQPTSSKELEADARDADAAADDDEHIAEGIDAAEQSKDEDAAASQELGESEDLGDRLAAMAGANYMATRAAKKAARASKKTKPTIQIWLPMTFPPVPKKVCA